MAYAQTVSTTTVQGTVYLANGTPGTGTLQLSWPAFTTAGNQTVMAGRTTVPIGADGFVSANLAPNLGATPAGLYYTAVFNMSDGTVSTEYWVVPTAAQATIAQVRAQVMPAVQAVQAVNKAYVDQAIQSLSSLTGSGGTLTGPLYLSSDPTQPLQAADKRYVDTTFSQAVPLTGASLTGPLTSVQLGAAYQVDQFAGADFGAKLQACLSTINTTYGGTCDARNFTGNLSMASNLTISTANTTILLPCATISTANQLIITAGTRNVALRGCALRGASTASGSQGGTVFLYSGTGAMIQVGDPTYATDTAGFHLDNAVINTTGANNSAAQGLIAYRTQEMDLQSLYFLGNSNQTGMTLDGTGNYTGGTFYDNEISGFQTAVNAIGHQVSNPAATDWLNASTFVRLHIDCPTSGGNPVSGTYGINLQQGDGNTFTGGDVEGCNIALHLGPNAQNNTIVGLRNENSNNQVVADSGSSYNSWMTGGTMFTGKLTDNGTRNSFLDTFHRSFNSMNGDWYGSQQDATLTNYYRIGIGAGNERGLLSRYQTDYGYRWTTGLSDATAGEQFYQVLDELNNVYRLSIGQYNYGQSSTNNQTVINAAGSGAIVLNGSNNSGTGGVVFGSGGPNEASVATINNAGNAQFNGTLQVGGTSTFGGSTVVRNQADAEIDSILAAGATTNQKESFIYRDYTGSSQWYMVKDANNDWALNSALGGLDSFKAYQSTNSGDTYINASNPAGVVRVNYETGAGSGFKIYGGNSNTLYAAFTGTTAIQFPGLAAGTGHNCLQVDNSGYITNTGAACGTGSGGSGTVNSGATGQIAYYNGSGTALSGISAVPVTAGGTGATTAGGALAALGGASLTSASAQSFAAPVSAPAVNASVNTQINVMAPPYNAVGDCVTDDHAAIQAAMAAAIAYPTPAVVYFPKPAGGCYLTSTLTWVGASLQGQPGTGTATAKSGGVTVRGMPGKDVFEAPDPSTTSGTAPNRVWSVKDLMIEVDDTSSSPTPSSSRRWPGRWTSDAAMTSGSATFTSANGAISCGDVGQAILVTGAGASGANLSTTISSVTPCWSNTPTVTLAASASTTVSGALAYISVLGLPVTTTIQNCGIAFDAVDGKSADNVMTGNVGGLGDVLQDVTIHSLSGAMYGQNGSCGIYTQGQWGMYGLEARNVNVQRTYYGIVQGVPDTNPNSASSGGDFERWAHGNWGGTFPWISYNGGESTVEDIQIQALNGPQILELGNAFYDTPVAWYIRMPEFGGNSGQPYGWRIEGTGHSIVNTALSEGATNTYIDANETSCLNCGVSGNLTIDGIHNNITLSSDISNISLASVTDNGIGNVITGQYLASAFHGIPQSRPAALNLNRGVEPVGRLSTDFVRSGNVSTPYFNDQDLFFTPRDVIWGNGNPQPTQDSTSLTGQYEALMSGGSIYGFATYSYAQSNTSQAMISATPTAGQIPAANVTVYFSAKCPSLTTYTLNVKAGSTTVASVALPCSTTYTTQAVGVNLSSYAGTAFTFTLTSSGEVDFSWMAVRPFQADYNGYQPAMADGSVFITARNWAWSNSTHPGIVDSTSPVGYSTSISAAWSLYSVNGSTSLSGGALFPAVPSKVTYSVQAPTVLTDTLGAAMAAGDTSITLAAGTTSSWATGGCLQVDQEIICYSGTLTAGTTTVTVTRGQYGTLAQAHSNGATLYSVGTGTFGALCNSITYASTNVIFGPAWMTFQSPFAAQSCSGYATSFKLTAANGPTGQVYKIASIEVAQDSSIPLATAANQVPVSGSSAPYPWTGTKTIAGSGAAIPTGPTTSVSGDVVTFNGTAGQMQDSGTLLTGLAKLASPTFTGTVTAPTMNATGGYQLNGTALAASNLSNGTTGTGSVVLAASPALSGTPTAPTASAGTNSTQVATTAFVAAALPLTGTTASIGGSALAAGACASGTVNITGATTSMAVVATPATYPGDGMAWRPYVSAAGVVTVKVCADVAGTPTASAYNVRVIQ
jgi:hypothetical protein